MGQSIDARSDIYSLTATLYYLLAGKAPFESPHAAQVIARIVSSDPPSFKSIGIVVPPAVEQIVMKGLARDASKRFASFTLMRIELHATIQPKSEPATLARRSLAWIADYFLMTSIAAAFMIFLFSAKDLSQDPITANLLGMVTVFFYYFIQESIFGTSIGKAAMRVSVVDAATGGRASLVGILIRSSVYILSSSLLFILLKWLIPDEQTILKNSVLTVTFFISIAVLYSTWRMTRKRQLLHDWLSGTECRTTSGAMSTASSTLKLPVWSLPVKIQGAKDFAIPKQLGRFSISAEIDLLAGKGASADEGTFKGNGSVQGEPAVRWWVGLDPQLERTIWVACVADKSIEYDEI